MDYISKKELLAATGISYGQLYRWKRERLIPESWFIKRPSYTGQETIFPKEQILDRIQAILDSKGRYSLEELAKIFSPESASASIDAKRLEQIKEICPELRSIIQTELNQKEYDFYQVVLFAAVSTIGRSFSRQPIPWAELLHKAGQSVSPQLCLSAYLTLFEAGGTLHFVSTKVEAPLQFDDDVRVLNHFSVEMLSDTIKLKYQSLFVSQNQEGGTQHAKH